MHGTIIKKIGSIFLLLIFLIASHAEKIWCNTVSPCNLQNCIVGAVTALIIGKISYDYYQSHLLTDEQFIENFESRYKKIYQDAQNYHNFYKNDAQISDWELKEIILHNNQEAYPFMIYYSLINQASLTLHTHLLTLKKQLVEIRNHKKQLDYTIKTELTNRLQETLRQLEIQGKDLQSFITKTITIIIILKNKIKLFKEYNDDCHASSQAERNTKFYPKRSSILSFLA